MQQLNGNKLLAPYRVHNVQVYNFSTLMMGLFNFFLKSKFLEVLVFEFQPYIKFALPALGKI